MCETETGKRGWVKTAYGYVRRVKQGSLGYGMVTGPVFHCPKGRTLFELNGLVTVQAGEESTWSGFIFNGAGGKQLRPSCDRSLVRQYPLLMVNAASRERGEEPNLRLVIWRSRARLQAT